MCACIVLGGGRETKDSAIDLSVGVVLHKKVGDAVSMGEPIATVHAAGLDKAKQAAALIMSCYDIGPEAPELRRFIKGIVR